jgi:glycosyltransferase involved in cell wall biosynthesis
MNVRFHLVGDGPEDYIDELRLKTNKAGVEEAVCWHGYLVHQTIPTILDSMDVTISPLPAHKSFEIFSPVKLYEFLAMGLPIFCTDLRAHRDAVIAEQTGFFFDPGSSPSLVDVINRISELESEEWLDIQHHAIEAVKKQRLVKVDGTHSKSH